MCGTCGCASEEGAVVLGPDGHHVHVLPDGRVVTHAHHGHEHHHHDHQPHGHAHHHHDHAHHHHDHAHHHHGPAHHHHPAPAPDGGALRAAPHPHVETLEAKILGRNDRDAERNRAFFAERELLTVNIMSSPGSGKTTLLERALRELELTVSVLEGDQETSNDADRVRATGAPVAQINTGVGCHLEASMVYEGARQLDPPPGSVLVIENVGNLVCPALFDLGEAARVVLFSVTEGEDKPVKYPQMFRAADLVLLTKCDLLPHLDFDMAKAVDSVRAVNPEALVLPVSSKSGAGMSEFYGWLDGQRGRLTSAKA